MGKIKSHTDALKSSGELKRMAGTTQAIEVALAQIISGYDFTTQLAF